MKHILLFILLSMVIIPQEKTMIMLFSDDAIDTTGYWIDGTNGDDSYAGNYSYPWKTIQKANTSATAGGTVKIKAGTYVENGTGNSLYSNKKLKYYGIGDVTVKGAGTTQVLNLSTSDSVWFYNITFDAGDSCTYVVYSGGTGKKIFNDCTFNYSNASARALYIVTGNLIVDNCTFNLSHVTTNPFDIRLASEIKNSVFNVSDIGTLFYTRSGGTTTISGNTITGSLKTTAGISLNGDNTTLVFSNNTITLTGSCAFIGNDATSVSGTVTMEGNNINIERNTSSMFLYALSAIPYYIKDNNITVTSTSLDDYIVEIRKGVGLIEGNTIETFTTSGNNFMVYIYSASGDDMSGTIIKDNILKHRSKTGYSIIVGTETSGANDNKIDSVLIEGNTIYGYAYYNPDSVVTIHGIFVGFNQNATIRYNKVYGSGYGIVVKGSNSYGGKVYYNVVENNWQGIRLKGVKKTEIYNNTIANYVNNATVMLYLSENVGSDGSDSTTIKNNIISNFNIGANNTYCIQVDTASNDGLISDYNCLYNLSDYYAAYEGATKTFAQWQALGLDGNSLNVDPDFTSATNFVLRATSDCIDAGTDVSLTRDILNNPIVGDPDIGGYESQ